jgi:hypothetical protein
MFGDFPALLRGQLQIIGEALQRARIDARQFQESRTAQCSHESHALAAVPDNSVSTDFPHFLAGGLRLGRLRGRELGHGLGEQH